MAEYKRLLVVPVMLVAVAALAACGSSGKKAATKSPASGASSSAASTSSTPTTGSASAPSGAVASIAAMVPGSLRGGSITVAEDASYAPDEFIGSDGHTVIGMDADLAKALGQVMGLKVNVVNVTFDAIIPGMAAGRYQLGMSSFTDTKKREQTVDFVDYANVGESFYTKAHGGTSISSISDICGLTVSVETGTTEQSDAAAQSAKCVKEGKKPVTVHAFPNQNLANLAVASGRAQLGFADTPVASYQVQKTGGQFKLVGAAYSVSPYGIAVAKQTGLVGAVKAALDYLIRNGTYASIFKKWGLSSIAVPASFVKINGATS
jgi:polar amino acid transport system substrate-binding protein